MRSFNSGMVGLILQDVEESRLFQHGIEERQSFGLCRVKVGQLPMDLYLSLDATESAFVAKQTCSAWGSS